MTLAIRCNQHSRRVRYLRSAPAQPLAAVVEVAPTSIPLWSHCTMDWELCLSMEGDPGGVSGGVLNKPGCYGKNCGCLSDCKSGKWKDFCEFTRLQAGQCFGGLIRGHDCIAGSSYLVVFHDDACHSLTVMKPCPLMMTTKDGPEYDYAFSNYDFAQIPSPHYGFSFLHSALLNMPFLSGWANNKRVNRWWVTSIKLPLDESQVFDVDG